MTGHATVTLVVGGVTLVRQTDGLVNNSGDALKTFVDAKIVLSPLTATNPINQQHVITANVYQDDGLTAAQGGDGVTGFAPAPNGTVVTFGLVNSNGATAAFVGSNTPSTSGGAASVTINSATGGTRHHMGRLWKSVKAHGVCSRLSPRQSGFPRRSKRHMPVRQVRSRLPP